MATEKEKVATSLKSHLQFLQSMGVTGVPKTIRTRTVRPEPVEGPSGGSTSSPRTASETLSDIRADVGDCQRCKLCKTRTNIVFGVGTPKAELMFIGEGPGADEDAQGEPFVGRAGQLLTKIIEAMGLTRQDVYINNIVMCRPPDNRVPESDEVAKCMPFLMRRIHAIKPKIIVCLGATAVKTLLGRDDIQITKIRGTIMDWNGYKVMPTLHPAYLLRNPPAKKEVWEDMQAVLKFLGKPVPQKK